MEEEEHVQYEEEEFTTIYRKTKRTQSKKTKSKTKKPDDTVVKSEIKLNPFLVGAKSKENIVPDSPRGFRKSDFVQQMVKDTLNEYKGGDTSILDQSNRLFLAECDYDDDEIENGDNSTDVKQVESKTTVWRFKKTGRKGLDRFRRMVEFVIIARQIFTCRRTVALNRRDKILFFMDTEGNVDNTAHGGMESEIKFDVNAFKSLGQKTNTAAIKSCLEVPASDRSDSQINKLMYMLRNFSRFSSYPAAIQSELCKKGWYAKFQSSQVLVKEGNKAEFYYLILSGLAVYRDIETVADDLNNTTNNPVTAYLKPGDTLGEKEILTNSERAATVVCREPVEVLGLDRQTFLDIFNAAGGLGSIDYLRKIPELRDFPLELLQTYHFSMAVHYYRRGAVIVKNSNESEWIYVVRSGSCQIYQALKDGAKTAKHSQGLSSKAKLTTGNGSLLPSINRTKNDFLKSASTEDLSDTLGKKKKKQHPGLERSLTLLPVINPGRTSMVQMQPQCQTRVESPTVQKLRRQDSRDSFSPKHRLKHSKNSPKSARKLDRNTNTESPLLTRHKTSLTLCDTPDIPKTPRLSQNPLSESVTDINSKRSSTSSDSEEWPKNRKNSSTSDPEMHNQTKSHDNLSNDIGNSSLFYVRLGMVNENEVFGMHPLVYDNTPSLSLISNGAECVLVSKQFLKDQINSTIACRLRNNIQPYPNTGQVRTAVDDHINWDNFREKVKKKKQHPGLERSLTLLPVINPGRTSMVQMQPQCQTRVESPTVQKLRRQDSRDSFSPKHRLKHSKNSPKSARKLDRNTNPESPLLTRHKSSLTLCDTPDIPKTPRLSQNPLSESVTDINSKRSSTSSDSEEWPKNRKNSSTSDPEMHNQTKSHDNLSNDVGNGSLFYVRLGMVNENEVFGMHPLVYDNTPSLSLISNGAECVLVSKQFLKDQINSTIACRLRNNIQPYPNTGQVRTALDDHINWDNFREKVVDDVLK